MIFTDGIDFTNRATLADVIEKRDSEKKQIFTVGFGHDVTASALRDLAGGNYLHVGEGSELSLSEAFLNIQQSIQDAANSLYWVNYASPARGGPRSFEISLKNNTYTGPDHILAATFNSDGFSDVDRGVVINRDFRATGGITGSHGVALDGVSQFYAHTILPHTAPQADLYAWTLGDSSLADLEVMEGDGSRIFLIPAGRDGTTTLTVTDTANRDIAQLLGSDPSVFTKTITLVFGSGASAEAEPVRLHSPARLADGRFRLTLIGHPGRTYTLEASDDLVRWVDLQSVTATEGGVQLTDPDAARHPQRFYRVRSE